MSQLHSGARQLTYNVKAFRGVNENSDGDANLKPGEAAVMRNFRITDGGALKVRPGYELALKGFAPTDKFYYWDEKEVTVISEYGHSIQFYGNADVVDGKVELSGELGYLDLFSEQARTKLDGYEECYFYLKYKDQQTGIDYGKLPFKFVDYIDDTSVSGVTVYKIRGKAMFENKGIVGMWSGVVAGEEMLLFARDGVLYQQMYNADGTPNYVKDIGRVDTGDHVEAFFFGDKVYLLDGTNYYSYDGETFAPISYMDAYIPIVITAADTSGSGTLYEQVNKLTPRRKIRYSADGTSTKYKLPEKNSTVVRIIVGTTELAFSEWTEANNEITFNTAPTAGSSNIEVTYEVPFDNVEDFHLTAQAAGQTITMKSSKIIRAWTVDGGNIKDLYQGADYTQNGKALTLNFATHSGQLLVITHGYYTDNSLVTRMRFAETFNGAADTRVFLYGNGTNKAIYSGVMEDGQPSAEYFPDLNEMEVGDANTPITAMIRHYNRLLVFKRGGGTYSIYYGQLGLADGSLTAGFYINSINKKIGCDRDGGAVLAINRPRTIETGNIYEWRATSTSGNITADQRNAVIVSERVQDTLKDFDMLKAYTYYDARRHEYYCVYNGIAVIQNMQADAWYIYDNFPATIMAEHDRKLYFGTADGLIYRVSEDATTDNGTPIDAFWESGSLDFGKSNELKYSPIVWVSALPEDKAKVTAGILTDSGTDIKEVLEMSPKSVMAKTLRAKLKSRKFAYYKLRLAIKESTKHSTILSAVVKASYDIPVK